MEQLPKIVRQRLRVTAQPGMHPDANVLAAFAEKSLGKVERQQVLAHLAQCADCRGLAFALPEPSAAAGITPSRTVFPWLSWPLLRWAAAAACVVIVGAAVTLRYAGHKSAAPSSAAKQEAAPAAEYKLAPQPPAAVVEGNKLALKVEPKMALQDQRDHATRVQRKAPAPPPLSNRVAATPSSGMGAAANVAGEVAQSNNPPPRISTQQVLVTGAAPVPSTANTTDLQKEARADANESKNAVPSVSESVEVQAEAPVVSTQATELAPGKAKDSNAALKKAAPGGTTGGIVSNRPMAPGQLALQGSQYDVLERAATSSARWSLSADGALERSLDAGKSWQTVPVAEHVVFRAVSATGPDVWAGGAGGALYHSTDGGQSWVQVKPSVKGSTLTDDIIGIEFSDANHGKVATAKHEVWVTNDAGQIWQKQ